MKKFFSIMLALVMVLGIMSVGTLAAEIVLDGGFEEYATDWTANGSTSNTENTIGTPSSTKLAISTSIVKTGSNALALKAAKVGTTFSVYSNKFEAPANRTNTVKVAVYPLYKYETKNDVDVARARIGFAGKYMNGETKTAYAGATTDWASPKINGEAQEKFAATSKLYAEFTVPMNAWSIIELEHTPTMDLPIDTYYTVVLWDKDKAAAIDAIVGYVDDFSVTYGETSSPTEFAVTGTTNNEAYGTVAASAATSEGEAVTFTVTPKLGYYVAAATLNGESVLGSFDAYEGGTYTVAEVAADVELAVEFAAVTAKGENVATLPAVFAPTVDSAVTFGKVLDTTDATSWGIELKKDGVGVTPYHGGSYHYKALATNANGQYAIEFVGLEAGEYQIRSYVYVNGTAAYGAPSTFVVE